MPETVGFDLDEETIETFDSILLALTKDPELQEEFKKLKFIQLLKNKHDSTDGPFKQMIVKMSQIEQEFSEMQRMMITQEVNMRRAVIDLTDATRAIRAASTARTATEQAEAIKKLDGLEYRQSSYTWNNNNGT